MLRLFTASLTVALLLALPGAAAAQQNPPQVPNSTKPTKKCGKAKTRFGRWRVYVIAGPVKCSQARTVVRSGPDGIGDYQYYDWTKGGNGPWSDIWTTGEATVGGILRQ